MISDSEEVSPIHSWYLPVQFMIMMGCLVFLMYSDVHAVSIDSLPSWRNEHAGWTSKVELADIDNDGYPDLVAASFIRGEGYTKDNIADIKIFRNRGGALEETAGQVIKMEKNVGSWNIALGDYDNDGDLDLAVGNIFEKKDLIFRNDQGVFGEKPVWESGDRSLSHGLDWVDYDRDGDLDLSVAAAYSGVKVYENRNGKISSRAKWESYEALDFQDVDWADMDRDGDLDLAVSNHNARPPGGIFLYKSREGILPEHRTWIPNKAKKYLPVIGLPLIETVSWMTDAIEIPGRLAWGDLNGDGFPELAVSNATGPAMVFYNDGGTLQKSPYWESGDNDNSFDLLFADVDNDGLVNGIYHAAGPEIKNVLYMPHRPVHAVKGVFVDFEKIAYRDYCYNHKDGWISIKSTVVKNAKNIRIEYIYSTDIDLVVAKSTWQGTPGEGKKDRIYLNGKGVIGKEAAWETQRGTLSNAVAAGDIDNDGDLDIVLGGAIGREGETRVPQHIYMYLNRTVE